MVQAESDALGCVCSSCGYRCRDCLGTDTVVSPENLRSLAFDPRFSPDAIAANFEDDDEMADDETRDDDPYREWRDLP